MEPAVGNLQRSHSESDTQAPPPFSSDGSAPDHARSSLKKTASFPARLTGAGNQVKKYWKTAVLKIRALTDPWVGVLDEIPPEGATRHMYDPHTGKWKTDEVVVKIQSESFAHGAMRECFRMKKLSKFSHNPDWSNASNYVAKRYMKEVSREVYFEDIKLQMDSKLWGEEYSKHNPPKKVDFFQTYIIELVGRGGSPLYCVEHLIDGKYIKYNSNSGFVSEVNRLTPQAFSHFTFEHSNHRLIVVDIQGVGDLYTDPQIHTTQETGYGEANLGIRGVALFFSSHLCSPLCQALGLTQFDLSEKEMDRLLSRRWHFPAASTALPQSKSEPTMATGTGGGGGEDGRLKGETVGDAFRRLSLSVNIQPPTNPGCSSLSSSSVLPPESPLDSPGITMTAAPGNTGPEPLPIVHEEDVEERDSDREEEVGSGCDGGGDSGVESEGGTRVRSDDVSWKSSDVIPKIMAPTYPVVAEEVPNSASVVKEVTRLREEEGQGDVGGRGGGGGASRGKGERESLRTLGMVHFDLATCHEMGRFSKDQTPDLESALFHLKKAASCGHTRALCTLACIHLQLPHQEFKEILVEATPANECIGMEYLVQAAERGVAVAMVRVAKAYETGEGLGRATEGDSNFPATQRHQDWKEAARWYSRALETATDEDSETQTPEQARDPDYTILARLAELHRGGGHGLERDSQKAGDVYTQAAEAAMASMKGKIANKFYMLAEEAWAEVPDD